MGKLDDAITTLKNAASKSKIKNKTQLIETVSQLKSYLVFLNSSSISPETAARLADRFRKPLLPVYTAFPQPALQFAAALSQELYEGKILSDFTAGKHDQKLLWNSVFDSLLSGILDYHDQSASEKCKEAIGAALFPALCSIFFSVSIAHMSVALRCTGYALLSECAEAHRANQKRLQDLSILGGPKLGGMLWRTRDYLVMENILNLFARMIPSTNGNTSGRAERSAFIRSVFVQSTPDDVKTGEEVVKVLEHVPNSDWDQTAAKIVDLLAASNIAFPQPFKITEIVACGQQKPSDRLYVDDKCFVANVLIGNDLYESLSVAYTSFVKIEIVIRSVQGKVKDANIDSDIIVSLSAPPAVGKELVDPKASDGKAVDPVVAFALSRNDLPRFHEALKSRGLGQCVTINKNVKLSLAESAANLELDSAGKLIGKDELEQRIDNLSQLYGTNESSDDVPSLNPEEYEADIALPDNVSNNTDTPALLEGASSPAHANTVAADLVAPVPGAPSSVSLLASKSGNSVPARVPAKAVPSTPLRRTTSQLLRDAVFGASDDDLSDVDYLPEPPMKPQKKKSQAQATFGSSLATKAPDSDCDNEAAVSSPTRAPRPRKVGKKTTVISDDEIEDVLPASKISDSSISRRRSVLRMSPLIRSKTRAPVAHNATTTPDPSNLTGHGRSSAQEVSGKDLDACNRKDTLDQSIKANSPTILRDIAPQRTLLKTPAADTSGFRNEAVDTPHKPQGHEPVLQSSSPVPVVKSERKSLKSALRKKDGALAQPNKSLLKPTMKRKRELDHDTEHEIQDDSKLDPPPKRTKSTKGITDGIQSEMTESQVLKPRATAAVRATKRYRAKKGQTSSSPLMDSSIIDYDKIPRTPPSSALDAKTKPAKGHLHPTEREAASSEKGMATIARRTRGAATRAKEPTEKKTSKIAATRRDEQPVSDIDNAEMKRSQRTADQTSKVKKSNSPPVMEDVMRDIPQTVELEEPITRCLADNINAHSTVSEAPAEILTDIPQLDKKLLPKCKVNQAPWDHLMAVKPPPAPVAPKPQTTFEPLQELNLTVPADNLQQKSEIQTTFPSLGMSHEVVFENTEQNMIDETPIEKSHVETIDFTTEVSPTKQARLTKRKVIIKSPSVDMDVVNDIEINNAAGRNSLLEDAHVEELAQDRRSRPTQIHMLEVNDVFFSSTPSRRPGAVGPLKVRYEVPRAKIVKDTTVLGGPREVAAGRPQQLRTQMPVIEELAEVLTELQEAILHKVSGRVENVRYTVRAGRERLLSEAATDLSAMHTESIDRYNSLIDLEAEYATFGRKLTHGFDDMVKADQDLGDHIRKTVETHDRCTLSKKMPLSIFPTSLPASIMKFKI